MNVLDRLGISNDILMAGKPLNKISIVDLNGNPIFVIEGNAVKLKHGFVTVAIHRAKLQQILASYIPSDNIVLNKQFISYQRTNNSVTAIFDDGTTAKGDFLIVADGIQSHGRLQIHSSLNLRYSGQTCWRFVTECDIPTEEDSTMYEIWSNQKGLRVGYSKINDKQVYVFITNYEKRGGRDTENVQNYLLHLCAQFPAIVQKLILSVHASDILRNDIFDFKPINQWVDGTLVGDAAHATTPNLGQGACQAIEDAYVVAEQLRLNSDIETSLRTFQDKRIKKATYITNTA